MIRLKEILHHNKRYNSCKSFTSYNNYFSQRHCSSKSFDKNDVELSYQKKFSNTQKVDSITCEDFYILPPPNITGNLHLGHALTIIIEDVMKRFTLSTGKKAIWYPGFDHAGIATQTVVERNLWKEKKQTRSSIPKEEFIKYCEKWKDEKIRDMKHQINKLSPLIDWDYSYYTMDNKFTNAVNTAFITLYNKNLIYRDKRIVNWCSSLQSVISDQEVKKITINSGDILTIPDLHGGYRNVKFGRLFSVKYKLVDCNKYIEVETSRPETIFADVGIAVNPNDGRYRHLIGRYVYNPLVDGEKLKIVPSDKVKIDFGSGMLKLTPSHSQVDFDIVSELIKENILDEGVLKSNCIDKNGCIEAPGTPFNGMDIFEGREKIINYLASKKLLKETTIKNYQTEIPICERSGNVIEGTIKSQWFMRTEDLNNDIKNLIMNGTIQVSPEFHYSKLMEWLSNSDPWCLSRQISWGHQIPAYKVIGNDDKWIVGNPNDMIIENSVFNLERDTDVLDTWFSSSLIPIVTGDWPTIKKPRKLSCIETGHDILGFWVARMLTVCYGLTGIPPFHKIFLHGLIRDSLGRKMSKSLGNVIDPLDVIDGITLQKMLKRIDESSLSKSEINIAKKNLEDKYPEGIKGMGSDALRYALLRHDVTSLDINVNILETADEGYRFCNKIWNMTNYAQKILSMSRVENNKYVESSNYMDLWIKSRLKSVISNIYEILVENFKPHSAFNHIYLFILNDLCDLYIESTKSALKSGNKDRINEISSTMSTILDTTFKILSIFMPQISDSLHEKIIEASSHLTNTPYRERDYYYHKSLYHCNSDLEDRVKDMYSIVSLIRSIRYTFGISKNKEKLNCFITVNNEIKSLELLKNVMSVGEDLCNIKCMIINAEEKDESLLNNCLRYGLPNNQIELYIEMPLEFLQKALENYLLKKENLEKKKEKYEKMRQSTLEELDKPSKIKIKRMKDIENRADVALNRIKKIDFELEGLEKDIIDIRKKIDRSSIC